MIPYIFIAGVIEQLLDQVQGSCYCISPNQLQDSNLALLYRQPKTLGNQEQVFSRKSKPTRKECPRNIAVQADQNRLRFSFKPIHWHRVRHPPENEHPHNEQFQI
jgi:hypothetical protein